MAFETHAFETAQLVDTPALGMWAVTSARWHDVVLQRVEFQTLRLADLTPFLQRVKREGGAAARAGLPTASTRAFYEPLRREGRQPGDTAEAGDPLALTLVEIPAGRFQMGSPPEEPERYSNEGPQHEVTLASFFLSQTPITQAQWREVAGWQEREGERWGRELKANPSWFQGKEGLLPGESNTDHRPVERVSWHAAMEFCHRLSQRTGRTYTLPSEAQWEYACRAGTTTPFYFGDSISPELANYDGTLAYADGLKGEYRQQTTPVGMFPANAWGLQDVHGNVWEWCLDCWQDSYDEAPFDGSAWMGSGPNATAGEDHARRLLRGGSWGNDPGNCRSACRGHGRPGNARDDVGFRVVCLPQDPSLNS